MSAAAMWRAMSPGSHLAIASSGLFLLVGLVTGVWKYSQIMTSPERRAHAYVDIAHRASLMYSFAALVLAQLAALSAFSDAVNVAAVAAPVAFFGVAIVTYVMLGREAATENQYTRRTFSTTGGVWMLAVAELAGVVVLLAGVAVTALSS